MSRLRIATLARATRKCVAAAIAAAALLASGAAAASEEQQHAGPPDTSGASPQSAMRGEADMKP